MKTNTFLWSAIATAQILSLPLVAHAGDAAKETKTVVASEEKAPPLPLHTIEGTGGVVITPIAYLVNPGPPGTDVGLPSASATYVNAGKKNVETLAVTETFFQRLELGYGASRFGVGSLVNDVKDATTVDISDAVILHNINARFLALQEGSFDLPLPAVTFGATYKINDGIGKINNQLGGALTTIGYDSSSGVDYYATATKAFPKVLGRPLILTAGVRFSEAAQLGYLGFGDKYRATFESNVVYGLTPWLFLAGEFRGKANPYSTIADGKGGYIVDREDNWWTVGAAFIASKHTTFTVGWGHFGPVLNTTENKALALQAKYEF